MHDTIPTSRAELDAVHLAVAVIRTEIARAAATPPPPPPDLEACLAPVRHPRYGLQACGCLCLPDEVCPACQARRSS